MFEHSEFPNIAINITFGGAIEGVCIDYLKRENSKVYIGTYIVYRNIVYSVKILMYQNIIIFSFIFKIKIIIINLYVF